jgi:hypothetical protein
VSACSAGLGEVAAREISEIQGDGKSMKRIFWLAVLTGCLAVPSLSSAQAQASAYDNNHVEVGVFADYFRLSQISPNLNMVGVGGRAAFNVHPNVQLEAEMAYDFKRNFTTTFNNGATTQLPASDR